MPILTLLERKNLDFVVRTMSLLRRTMGLERQRFGATLVRSPASFYFATQKRGVAA